MTQWIKCSERLPDKDGQYLLYINFSSIVIGSFVKELNKFYKQKLAFSAYNLELKGDKLFKNWSKETRPYKKIQYWMPLPPIPEE